jgi:hypothetical protein
MRRQGARRGSGPRCSALRSIAARAAAAAKAKPMILRMVKRPLLPHDTTCVTSHVDMEFAICS